MSGKLIPHLAVRFLFPVHVPPPRLPQFRPTLCLSSCLVLTEKELSLHCGFYTSDFTTSPDYQQCHFDLDNAIPGAVWNDFCYPDAPPYDAWMTKGSAIRDPDLCYLHRLITATISGRRESTGVVTQRDLFYLHCFRTRQVPHLGYGFALYMVSIARKKKGALCGGPYITRLAKSLGVFSSLRGLTQGPPMIPFDIRIMRSMGLVTKRNGQYLVEGQPPIGPPPAPAVPPPQIPDPSVPTPVAAPHDQFPPDAPEMPPPAPSSFPSSSAASDQDDLRRTVYEMQHVQRFLLARQSWICNSLQLLCQAQNVPLPPCPELHDFQSDADDDTAPIPGAEEDEDDTSDHPAEEDVDVTSVDPAEDAP